MKKRIKTNCNYTLKPETHSFLGEKGKDIIFSGSGYAECEGTNAIIVNWNQYYNADDTMFNNNSFGIGAAINKRLRCNSFSFQIRNKNLYGASLLNLQEGGNNDWDTITLTADPATGAVHWVGGGYDGNSDGDINIITFFNSVNTVKTYNIGDTPVYFSCLAKGLKLNCEFAMYLDVDIDDEFLPFLQCKDGGLILNEELETEDGILKLNQMRFYVQRAPGQDYVDNSQDVWFYPVISTEPITEEFFDNYVGFVPFPKYPDDVDVIAVSGDPEDDEKIVYALSYDMVNDIVINDVDCDYSQDYIETMFPFYFKQRQTVGNVHRRDIANNLKLSNENYEYQWVWNTLNTGIMGNSWAGEHPIEESLITPPLVFNPLFLLGYHHGGLSLISTGEKIPAFAQDADQEIRPVIQTLFFVNYEAQVPDYISPVYTIVYPTLVDVD